jgi:hypothetical protein
MATSGGAFAGGPASDFFTATAIGTEATVHTTTAGKRFRLTGMAIALSASASITVRDGTAGSTIFVVPLLAANTPLVLELGEGLHSTTAGNLLTFQSSAAANLSGTLFVRED